MSKSGMRGEATRAAVQGDELTTLLRIINLVRLGEVTTRPEIGRVTGFGRGVVTQRVEQAMEMGFLAEGERGPSSGGRAPRTLRFTAERGRIVVCALGALHIHVGISALDGDVIDDIHRSWEIARGPDETLDVVMTMLDELFDRNEDIPVWGVAVGLPGPVDFASGRPMSPPIMPNWNGHNVKARFEQRFGAPVWVDNDVNLLALGERARRRDDNVDLVYCKTGTGIGVGLLSQGRIHRGASGSAGDIGHLRVPGSTVPCLCGKTGCLEAVAGGWALVRDAEQAVAGGASGVLAAALRAGSTLIPEDVSGAAEKGDPLGISLIQRSAQVVGEAIASLVNTFNPAVIVLGGAIAAGAGEIFLAEVRQRVYELALPLATRDLMIVRSVNDPREPLRGGAEMIREQLFDRTFARWFAGGRPSIEMSGSRTGVA